MTDAGDRPAPLLTARELRARQGVLDAGLLDAWRAKLERYGTTRTDCRCPDFTVRRPEGGCKHMIALRLLEDKGVPA